MKLGIMQPYFFPYLGYFDLINYSDEWIVFDVVQYIRHGWINRNRIMHPGAGWSYVIVPVRAARTTPIREVAIVQDGRWKKRILGQLRTYKKTAPYFSQTMHLVEECLDLESDSISRLDALILDRVCACIGIKFKYRFLSEMTMNLGPIDSPGDWALRISQALGAEEYVNPPGGRALFEDRKFRANGIRLTIRQMASMQYDCVGRDFVPDLSIIDVLMWNSPEAVKAYLDLQRGQGVPGV